MCGKPASISREGNPQHVSERAKLCTVRLGTAVGVGSVMKISVVIVSWNAKAFLLQCLDSVFRQSVEGLEVLVVDNASSDGSADAVADNYPGVKLIRNGGNDGFAKGNTIGIRA